MSNIGKVTKLKETLFNDLTALFLEIGFTKDEIIVMENITAGDYVVANSSRPTDLPRFLCLLDKKSILKVECAQLRLNNYKNLKDIFNSELITSSLIRDYTLIDETTGYILDEFSTAEKDVQLSFKRIEKKIYQYKNEVNVFKAEFSCPVQFMDKKGNFNKKATKNADISGIDLDNEEVDEILEFLRSLNKSIQAKQLLRIFPQWSKEKALITLKTMVDNEILVRKGSWFKLE